MDFKFYFYSFGKPVGGCDCCWDGELTKRDWGCAALGLAAGNASGFNPLVGGLTTLGCMLTSSHIVLE